jgi:hypothetical protein
LDRRGFIASEHCLTFYESDLTRKDAQQVSLLHQYIFINDSTKLKPNATLLSKDIFVSSIFTRATEPAV